ncbi:MAG: TIGR01777 family oxidoreductase [Bacteriovoracaceae bacterium]|nr:TIGR01777 family oxidoreductase [Bacteriovoracaceae bacterium]
MKVLVTGATGLVGKKLVAALIHKGHQVTITSRESEKARTIFQDKVKIVTWKDYNSELPLEAVLGIDSVIHLMGENIGAKRWSKKQKIILRESRINSAQNIMNTLLKNHLKLKSFITSSAIGIYPMNLQDVLTESSVTAGHFLADLCRQWEKSSDNPEAVSRHVAIRTGVVLGEKEGAMAKLLPIFKFYIGGPIGDGTQMMSWIHVDDLVKIYIEALENESIQGAINAVSPNAVDNFTFSKALANSLHRPSLVLTPAFPLKIALGEMSTVILDSQHVYPEKLMKNGFHFQFPTIDQAFNNLYQK